MKKAISVFVLAVLLLSCTQSPQNKAEKLVTKYLKDNLHNPQSYEPVEFSQIDSLFSPRTEKEVCPESLKLQAKADEFDKIRERYFADLQAQSDTITDEYRNSDEFQNKIANAKTYLLGLIDSTKNYTDNAALAQLKFDMKGEFKGYRIEHKYRADNKMGAKVLGTDVFFINPTITEVTDYKTKE